MHLTVFAPAKINLFLDITGKRSDGYHIINTVMQSVTLYDDVTVGTENDNQINIWCSDPEIPCDQTNTAYKAVAEFFKYSNIPQTGISVKIKKRIPSQAGMAGGSTDAAAVLIALNEMFDTHFDKNRLAELAEKIGSDVPFCIYGGTMAAGGIGTILSPLPDIPKCYILIVKPEIKISTHTAYEQSDRLGYSRYKSSDKVIDGICNGNLRLMGQGMYNKFEEVSNLTEISKIKKIMKNHGAVGSCLTGSGSAVFGIFESRSTAESCSLLLSGDYDDIYITEPTSDGQIIK